MGEMGETSIGNQASSVGFRDSQKAEKFSKNYDIENVTNYDKSMESGANSGDKKDRLDRIDMQHRSDLFKMTRNETEGPMPIDSSSPVSGTRNPGSPTRMVNE
jgi:hypothetical protein